TRVRATAARVWHVRAPRDDFLCRTGTPPARLLLSYHRHRTDHRSRLARGSVYKRNHAPTAWSRDQRRPPGYWLSDASWRATPGGYEHFCGAARLAECDWIQSHHGPRWTRHRRLGNRICSSEDARKSFWRSFRSR